MTRKIPIFKVKLSNGATYEHVKEHPQIRKAVIEESLFAIKHAVKTNKKSVSLFQLDNTGMVVELDKKDFKVCLNSIMNYYLELEDYNKCIEIRDLNKQI